MKVHTSNSQKNWWTSHDRFWVKAWYWLWSDVLYHFPRKQIYYLTKVYAYAKVLRRDFDWDSAYIYDVLMLKLERTRKACYEDGHHIDDYNGEKSIKLAIKLCKRLREDNYMDRWWRKHEAKWGEHVSTKGRVFGRRVGIKTEEDAKQEHKEALAWMELEEKIKVRDRKWLFGIMAKYMPYWWD